MNRQIHSDCDLNLLRGQLSDALVQADLCDPVVAIHVETALACLDEKFGSNSQSSAR